MTPVLRADGGADLLVEIDSIVVTVGAIEPPWATDADGHDVATHYTVEGNALVQHVAHGPGDAYPVTADPTFSLGLWAYLPFNRAETATIASGGWGATALTALCATAASPLGPVVAALMGASAVHRRGQSSTPPGLPTTRSRRLAWSSSIGRQFFSEPGRSFLRPTGIPGASDAVPDA